MGVAISSWKLAQTVSKLGHLGVVSGTGIAIVTIARLMQGDKNGDVRRALSHFPDQEVAQRILDKYFVEGGVPEGTPQKRATMWSHTPKKELNQLTVVSNFVEVWLAKEGHDKPVGINLLEKVQLPNMSSLYGAMLAGIDVVIIGAGIPTQIPGILDKLAEHKAVDYRIDVLGANKDDDYRVPFDPQEAFPSLAEELGPLKRPMFFPIISSNVLAMALAKKSSGEIQGFVVETPIAGGHNAPPRGKVELNSDGEPVYGEKDAVDLDRLKKLGYPFWLAGGYGSPEGLSKALEAGAQGVQVGTAFAYCEESGMDDDYRLPILEKVKERTAVVRTDPLASPTGFPFKVVQLEGTMSDPEVYKERPRVCDVGFLRHIYKKEDGSLGYRCPSEPVEDYVKKGGKIEDTVGRTCLCNHLGSTAGYANTRRSGYTEPPIVTSGDDLVNIGQFFKDGSIHYSAADVIEHLMAQVAVRP
jgi:nitronate monooxygenase